MKRLFDSNILIDYLKGIDQAHTEIDDASDRNISVITWMEVQAGAQTPAEEDVIDMFLRDFRLIGINRAIAREAIELRKQHRIRLPDAIIWATARTESALLVTRDTKDFPADQPGVRVPYTFTPAAPRRAASKPRKASR